MIFCKPKSFFSWDYDIRGDGLDANLSMNRLREEGSIDMNGIHYQVSKHGVASGMWTMKRGNTEYAVAQKIRAATRRCEIQSRSGLLSLRPTSPLRRSFVLVRSEEIVATIEVSNWLTRRATIDLSPLEEDLQAVCFAFWLAVASWKRAG